MPPSFKHHTVYGILGILIQHFTLYIQGIKRSHDHIGNLSNFTWLKEECIYELNQTIEENINYSDLARRYKLQNINGEKQ